jgi:hypothetical protein
VSQPLVPPSAVFHRLFKIDDLFRLSSNICINVELVASFFLVRLATKVRINLHKLHNLLNVGDLV